jgi:hypothetical protein
VQEIEWPILVQRIDARANLCACRAPAGKECRRESACFVAPRRWREIFEILDEYSGPAGRHRVMRSAVGARAEEPGAQQRVVAISRGHHALSSARRMAAMSIFAILVRTDLESGRHVAG